LSRVYTDIDETAGFRFFIAPLCETVCVTSTKQTLKNVVFSDSVSDEAIHWTLPSRDV